MVAGQVSPLLLKSQGCVILEELRIQLILTMDLALTAVLFPVFSVLLRVVVIAEVLISGVGILYT